MLVVDTSIVIKWYVNEADSEAARLLAAEPLIAPDLLAIELANALWAKVRRNELRSDQAHASLSDALSVVQLVPSCGAENRILEIAIELDHPACDCTFLALAGQRQRQLVTADTRLLRRCAGTRFAPLVRALQAA